MKKIDKIKKLREENDRLTHELGRYMKKVADQAKVATRMRGDLDTAYIGNQQTQRAVDALMIQTALACGVDAVDEDTGKIIGRRLCLPIFSVDDTLARYEVHARRDEEKGEYVIGVIARADLDATEELHETKSESEVGGGNQEP